MKFDLPTRFLWNLVCLRKDKVFARKEGTLPYIGLEHMGSESPDLLGTADSATSVSTNNVFEKNDILFGKLRPNLRKSVLAPSSGYCSTDILVLRVQEGINPSFVAKVFQSEPVFRQAIATAIGTKMPRTSWSALKNISVFCPPLPEQRRIAGTLETIDQAIRQVGQVISKLRQMKQGLSWDLLWRGLDENGRMRPPPSEASREYVETEMGLVPRDWKIIKLHEAGEVTLGRQRSPEYQRGRHLTPYLRVANVFDGWIDYSDVLEMDFTPLEKEVYGLIQDDILLNEGQSIELVGRSAIFDGPPMKYCFQNTLIRFRAKSENDPRYCRAVFKLWLDSGRFVRIARQTTSVAHLGSTRLANMPFPKPSPPEQRAIVHKLSVLGDRIQALSAHRAKLQQIRSGLMDDLLTGRVRAMGRFEAEG